MTRTPVKWFVTIVAVPIALVVAVSLASFESPSSASPTTTSTPASASGLCSMLTRVDRLIVTRHAPHSQFRFTFPAVVTVNSAAAARAVATAACALPLASTFPHSCPAEFAVSYQLDFAVRGEKGMGGESIVLNPTGCELVTGLGAARMAGLRPSFYRILGNAMGLKHAGQPTFAGTFKS